MIDPRTQALLQRVFRRESLSMLRYVGEAFPWTSAGGDAALRRLREIEAEDREATADLGLFLFRRRIPPSYTGSFPSALHHDQLYLPGISVAPAGRIAEEGRWPTWSATWRP